MSNALFIKLSFVSLATAGLVGWWETGVVDVSKAPLLTCSTRGRVDKIAEEWLPAKRGGVKPPE